MLGPGAGFGQRFRRDGFAVLDGFQAAGQTCVLALPRERRVERTPCRLAERALYL